MKNYLHRFYPYQVLRLYFRSLRSPLPIKSTREPTKRQRTEAPNDLSVRYLLQTLDDIVTAKSDSMEHTETDLKTALQHKLGFMIHKAPSVIPGAGMGVVLKGSCQKGQLVSFYPGTVYLPYEPLFFASIANRYILKCYDGIYIDGKATGLSAYIHSSVYYRENYPGATQSSDITWMKDQSKNPLAIGQIVNNGTEKHPANVYYQEIDLSPTDFPRSLRQYLPNTYWNPLNPFTNTVRVVALVSSRDIQDEELFSSYMDAF